MPATRRRRLLNRRLRAAGRSLQITKAGWLFLVFTLMLGFAAINTGSNLLHLLFGAAMTLIVVSGVLSERNLARASCRIRLAEAVHARTEATIELELTNDSPDRHVLAVAIEQDDDVAAPAEPSRIRPAFAVAIPPRGQIRLGSRLAMPTRGRHELPALVVATSYPFGLFVKRRRLPALPPAVVYPHVHAVTDGPSPAEGAGQREDGSAKASRAGDFYAFRDYVDGDDARHIHWKASARRRQPVVAEHHQPQRHEHWLELALGRSGDPTYEAHVEHLASIAVATSRHGHARTGLRTQAGTVVPLGHGTVHQRRMLEALAFAGSDAA
ncbi:MAG: DUF58 domain-containing protein [Myxococcales bacterium FL481]|nr:MAG: DUF58 domain-containing protein [Myxococcales bacterium FL481]